MQRACGLEWGWLARASLQKRQPGRSVTVPTQRFNPRFSTHAAEAQFRILSHTIRIGPCPHDQHRPLFLAPAD